MTHAAMDADARRIAGISETLLRLSIGIESADDLIRDLHSGLERAAGVPFAGRSVYPVAVSAAGALTR
jgi:cystathionine gamma-synthase